MSKPPYVDFHCHIDLYPGFPANATAIEGSGIWTLAVTTTPRAWPRNREVSSKLSYVHPALGLHPQLVAEQGSRELALWEKHLTEARFVGEVGLDAGPRFYRSLDQQKQVFERILQMCSEVGDRILSIHSLRATIGVLDLLEKHLPPNRGRAVLHWFTGTSTEARRALQLGCCFSVNMEMLASPRIQKIVASLPLDRILTETDGPFTQVGPRPSEPADIATVVSTLATLRNVDPEMMRRQIYHNLQSLCGD